MKREFSKGFETRKRSVFAKIGSRGDEMWYNNCLSKIDSRERIWLIVFTRPDNYNPRNGEAKWWLKFWIWDSETNSIMGENILFSYLFHAHVEKTLSPEGSDIAECYMHKDFERIVFRACQSRSYLIFDFSGNLVAQTERNTSLFINQTERYYSTFVNKDLFITRLGNDLWLYHLNEKTDDVLPKKTEFIYGNKVIINEKFKLFFHGDYCILSALDQNTELGSSLAAISVYKRDTGDSRNFYFFKFKSCFGSCRELHNIEISENEEYLIISLQCEDTLQSSVKKQTVLGEKTALTLSKIILK